MTGLQIGKLESGVSVACITDGDRDLTTADDRTMTLIAADGTQQQVVTGCVSAPVFAQPVWSDSPLLLWYDTYNLSCTADGKEIAQLFAQGISGLTDAYTLLPDGRIVCSNGTHVLLLEGEQQTELAKAKLAHELTVLEA